MPHWIRPLGLALAATALLGCSSIPFIGSHSLDVKIRGVELDQVVSMYVIVGDEADLGDIDDPRTIDKVVRPERHGKYVSFGQFKPVKGPKSWLFEKRTLKPDHPKVEVSVSKKTAEVEFEIDRKLLESHPQLSAAVVVNCGTQGWGAYQRISSFQIKSTDDMTLEVRGPVISLAGSGKQPELKSVEVPK